MNVVELGEVPVIVTLSTVAQKVGIFNFLI